MRKSKADPSGLLKPSKDSLYSRTQIIRNTHTQMKFDSLKEGKVHNFGPSGGGIIRDFPIVAIERQKC